jgi:oxaloacetate decarboxylase
MNWTERRERFRAILSGNRCVHPGSVYDAISARIAEDLGFEVGMFAGSIGSMSVLGAPDLIVLTLTEFAGQAYRICRAGNLALLVDSDHGYGNALNVKRTVEELETAGVAALTIEDTVLPRPYGASGKPSLIPLEEGTGKMRAALAGRQDRNLVVAGRTGALAISGVDETIKRAKAYEAAGVDAVSLGGKDARRDRGGLVGDSHSAVSWRYHRRTRRSRLSLRPQRQNLPAGARAVFGGGVRGLRDVEGASQRGSPARAEEHRVERADAPGDPCR